MRVFKPAKSAVVFTCFETDRKFSLADVGGLQPHQSRWREIVQHFLGDLAGRQFGEVVIVADEERKLIGCQRLASGDERVLDAAPARELDRARNARLHRLLVIAELAVGKNLDVDASGQELFQGFLEFHGGDVAGMNLIGGVR
jgi:hypothetical protein